MGFPAHGPHRTLPAGLRDPGPRDPVHGLNRVEGTRDLFEPDTVTLWPHSQLAWHLSSELSYVLLGNPLVLGETTAHRWETSASEGLTSALLGPDQCLCLPPGHRAALFPRP